MLLKLTLRRATSMSNFLAASTISRARSEGFIFVHWVFLPARYCLSCARRCRNPTSKPGLYCSLETSLPSIVDLMIMS